MDLVNDNKFILVRKVLNKSITTKIKQQQKTNKMENLCTIITSDQKEYKLHINTLRKYSNFFEVMIDGQQSQVQMEPIQLGYVSSSAFDYIYEFLQLHKSKPPIEAQKPVLKDVNLGKVMSEEDAELMGRISQLPVITRLQIMNAVVYLQMETFKKLLTYALMQKELQSQPQPPIINETLQEEIRKEIQSRINSLIEMENHRKRLQEENFVSQE